MYKQKTFWIIFVIMAILASIFVVNYFPKVMSFVNVDIQMDREEAKAAAKKYAAELDIGPSTYEQAVYFDQDFTTQVFTELEGGGKAVFNDILKAENYYPYYWAVRHYQENVEQEVFFTFNPQGQLIGIDEHLPETTKGNNVASNDAQVIAETFAGEHTGFQRELYELIETKREKKVSGLIQHTFVYERPDIFIGLADSTGGRYRYRLEVAGDKVIKATSLIKIPEVFYRKYSEMRSFNNTIASSASTAMLVLYGLLGIGFGIFMLMRQRWLIWKKALFWAFFVSFLGLLASFNEMPISWISYDTAIAKSTFGMQLIMGAIMGFVQDFLLLALTFMAAEGLTRKAFGPQVKFWNLWSKGVANTKEVLGYTVAGYLVPAFSLTYVLSFSYVTTRFFGWWNPASLAVQPNALAAIAPWFSPISMSLHAGFWEEALFRAIPLAGAVLIGRKYGKEKLWLIIALFTQAIIFGAGHANYAAQPSFARVVELILPSFMFAFLYLRFNLLLAVITHFVFDAVLMSIPIWVMSTPTIWVDRSLFLLLFLVPIIVVIYRYFQARKWEELSADSLNSSWQAPAIVKEIKEKVVVKMSTYSKSFTIIMIVLGIIGLGLWFGFTKFSIDEEAYTINKANAKEIAVKAISDAGIEFDETYQIMAKIVNRSTLERVYIWQNSPDVYQQLLNEEIYANYWQVRFARFEGSLIEKTREYNVIISPHGKVLDVRTRLPETALGASLSEVAAQAIALAEVKKITNTPDSLLKFISAAPTKRINRMDWRFVYADTLAYTHQDAEKRIAVQINGDAVVGVYPHIFVPEEWQRTWRNRTSKVQPFMMLGAAVLISLILLILILAIVKWSKKEFDAKFMWQVLIIIAGVLILEHLLNWEAIKLAFSTAEPLNNQIFMSLMGLMMKTIFISFAMALALTLLRKSPVYQINYPHYIQALSGGVFAAGLVSVLSLFDPQLTPHIADADVITKTIPIFAGGLDIAQSWLRMTLFSGGIFYILSVLTNGWTKKKLGGGLLTFALVATLTYGHTLTTIEASSLIYFLVTSLVLTIVMIIFYQKIVRHSYANIPLITAGLYLLRAITNMIKHPYQQAGYVNIVGLIMIVFFAMLISKCLVKKTDA